MTGLISSEGAHLHEPAGTSIDNARVAIVHDYLTQRGGAERVVLAMIRAFPGAPVYTSLYVPAETFPEFALADIRVSPLNRVGLFRRRHRLALPFLARAFSRTRVDADVVVCSSSGWAHGVATTGAKIVYCHTPAHWLYEAHDYLAGRRAGVRLTLRALTPYLRQWDRAAAASADTYLTQSSCVRERIRRVYGIAAHLLPAPFGLDSTAALVPIAGIEPGYFLVVSRLMGYKNVDAIVEAARSLRLTRVVVVGSGPERERLRRMAPGNVRFLEHVSDAELRWLYANCSALVAAGREDYGLTPLEAAAMGKPSIVLRGGGFLDTVVEGVTGIFFDRPEPALIRLALEEGMAARFDPIVIRRHAREYEEPRFIERLREYVRISLESNRSVGEAGLRERVDSQAPTTLSAPASQRARGPVEREAVKLSQRSRWC